MCPNDDVPSPIDLRSHADATTWAAEADAKRPYRRELRAAIAGLVRDAKRILELAAGPGLLAEAILETNQVDTYTAFDFSPPMLEMCRRRLGDRASYVLGDFLQPAWTTAVSPPYDAVVTMQAVHELRHKRRARTLYAQIRDVLRGRLVVCDHDQHGDLYATEAEQHAALAAAGYTAIATELSLGGLYIISALNRT
jgi:SAM-dependent methyltransferase